MVAIDRRNMNIWEDDAARGAIVATGRQKLIFSGLLTEACVTFPALSALAAGYEVHVVGDACGELTPVSHDLRLRRMEAAGAKPTSWIEVLLELQRNWTRHETHDGTRAIIEAHGGGYGIGRLCTGYDQARVTNALIVNLSCSCATYPGWSPKPQISAVSAMRAIFRVSATRKVPLLFARLAVCFTRRHAPGKELTLIFESIITRCG
ncbi:isochorismatase family protein [Rhizobium sp. P32RR-XVIII]|uniref:isochorismatase family protein n=1 Tax=Rhizobium sp. P32RR-XVIII TaxID=2726738 RepID=UPI001FEDBC7D|nr:isochorismatase family protein [Rhizobium sp. P32RR-XVIII]